MKSISTKIKLASTMAVFIAVGVVLYAKADKISDADNSAHSKYTIKSTATTNLEASVKTQARTLEYTSSEYLTKIAPNTSEATDYIAMYDDRDGYQRKSAPVTKTTSRSAVEGQRTPQSSSATYNSFGVRDVSTENVEEVSNSMDDAEEIEEPVRRRAVIAVDGSYPRRRVVNKSTVDYAKAMDNAAVNDDAYQKKTAPMPADKSRSPQSGGYAVRSANIQNANTTAQNVQQRSTTEGYARKRAPSSSYGESATRLAQYENANSNDKAYKVEPATSSDQSYGGYAVRSADVKKGRTQPSRLVASSSADGYARRRAPIEDGAKASTVSYAQADSKNPARNAEEEYGGYAVRSAGIKSTKGSSPSNMLASSSADGYARRRVSGIDWSQVGTNLAQYDNANRNDKAYQAQASSDEEYGGYAVRSAGAKKTPRTQPVQQAYAQNTTAAPTQGKGGVPRSSGIKKYGVRGELLGANISTSDRSVIVMPKRGRCVTGLVIQDNPGRSIVVQSSTGAQSTYNYGEIDALVNL